MVEINFNPSGDVFNVFTKAILPNNLSSGLLKHDEIGNELYLNFIKERINGNLSVWKAMKRCNLKTFGSIRKSYNLWSVPKKFILSKKKTLWLSLSSLLVSDLNYNWMNWKSV